ncbi:hypothetical protein [Burkholderia multivorans]|uniref:hypothetical protein n=1 Tax=Burkholderia multivorans TaxID=87883 RepID=UPI0021BE6D54|nr:hypothetical protein [Burkholderia multivorans]
MTVTTDVQSIVYDTDGSTTDFPIPFYFLRDTDITAELVDANANLTELNLGTDFTVTGSGQPGGGDLIATSAFASGYKLHIYRVVPVTQESQYQQNDPFPAKTTEKALDKLTMLVQQQKQTTDRALTVPRSDLNPQTTLPSAPLRANRGLGFDAAGNPVAIDLTIGAVLAPVVHSIAMLRLVSKFQSSDAFVLGYYNAGDGGGGPYFKAYDVAPTGWENGGTQIVAADGAGWQMSVTGQLTPQHFGAVADNPGFDSYQAISAGLVAAAAIGARWHWPKGVLYSSNGKFQVPALLPMSADAGSQIKPYGSAVSVVNDCVFESVRDSDGMGSQYFPSVSGFLNAYAFTVHGNLKHIYCSKVDNCYGIVKFPVGQLGNILDSIVEVNQGASLQVGMNLHLAGTGVMQGSGLKGNFLTNTRKPVLVTGSVNASRDTNFIEFRALDMSATSGGTDAVLANESGMDMPTFRLTVTDWFGGNGFNTAPYTQFATGVWNYANIQIHAAGWSSNWDIGKCLPSGRLKSFRVKDTQFAGTQKFIASRTQGVANFTNGVCSFQTDFQLYCRHKSTDAAIAAGANATFYAYNIWGDSTQNMWRPTVLSMDSRFSLVSVVDNSATNQGEIVITVKNISASSVGAADVDTCVLGFSHA